MLAEAGRTETSCVINLQWKKLARQDSDAGNFDEFHEFWLYGML